MKVTTILLLILGLATLGEAKTIHVRTGGDPLHLNVPGDMVNFTDESVYSRGLWPCSDIENLCSLIYWDPMKMICLGGKPCTVEEHYSLWVKCLPEGDEYPIIGLIHFKDEREYKVYICIETFLVLVKSKEVLEAYAKTFLSKKQL